ncbi:Hypothetical predicted protein [Mytilus galloprovincialis]|uniref:DUF5641 domain-containing protein n=1 Tax=Mytilus galloprovincialis TaxID=29158 RepID=A0A8B6BQE8_MYTGA|nr:Hypothetical predicted protein [Mytilus galloprovincialis]
MYYLAWNSEEAAIKYFNESRELLKQGGFNLRSWMSNSDKLRDLALSEKVLDSDKETKIFGMRWDAESDTLSFAETKQLKMDTQLTKQMNPADLQTRGLTASQFEDSTLWMNGPQWLTDECKWPTWTGHVEISTQLSNITGPKTHRSDDKIPSDPQRISQIIDMNRYSDLNRLLTVTGYVLKFVKNCQKKRPYRLRSSQEMHNDKHNANIQELDTITANKLFERKGLLLDHFAKRWSNEYLTGLREYHRASGKHTGQVNIGDVVQLGSESPRLLWRLGTIEDVIKGGDGLIRAAKVRTSRGLVTTRPIRKGLLLDHFAKRWSNEYLTGLREYHRASGKHTEQVNIGDVVQLGSESPRLLWRLGTIEDVIKGGDGLIRAAKSTDF